MANIREMMRLEELLRADIDAACDAYSRRRNKEQRELFVALKKAKGIQSRYQRYVAAKQEMQRMSKELNKLGFGVDRYGDNELYVIVPSEISAVKDFDAVTDKTKGALTDMKRAYSLKLFAGGEAAQALFASLAAELKRLMK